MKSSPVVAPLPPAPAVQPSVPRLRLPLPPPVPARPAGRRLATALAAGRAAGWASRLVGAGSGTVVAGRALLTLDPSSLGRLAAGRQVVLVSGTNGKTTTSHFLAAAARTLGPVAHNATGANMAEGAVSALADAPDAPIAVLEVDELHLPAVATAIRPAAVVLLNLTRDQLDRATEVRAIAEALHEVLLAQPDVVVIANADDPMVVSAATGCRGVVWVSAGHGWTADTAGCPRCGQAIERCGEHWSCRCGLARPTPAWRAGADRVDTPDGVLPVALCLPGRFNVGNAAMALAAASLLGVEPSSAVEAMTSVTEIAGRYAVVAHGEHQLRLLLAKNPAGWAETLDLVPPGRPLVVAINAREADGRDTSWLWDVPFDRLGQRPVLACGERAHDVGVRLGYAGIGHRTAPDPLVALSALPPGPVDVVANYTAFHQLRRRLAAAAR